jgi:signal transduction histidine kinase
MLLSLQSLARCFTLASLLIGASTSAHAEVHDHISQRAYWEDTTAQATLQDTTAEKFTTYDGILSRGYTTSATWIQLQITPSPGASANEKLLLRIRPVYLDEITLYDPLDLSGRARKTGDQTDYKNEEYKSLSHTFVIPSGSQPRTIWLRLKANSTSMMLIEALSSEDMQKDEQRLMLTYYGVLSLTAIFMLMVLINWVNDREFLYAVFVVRNALYLFYTASFFGFHRYLLGDWFDAQQLDVAYNWMVLGVTGFSFWVEIKFLEKYDPPRWVKNVFRGLLLWSATCITLLSLGQTNLALRTNMTLTGTGVVTMLCMAWIFIDDKKLRQLKSPALLKKKFVVGYYFTITTLLVATVLPYLGKVAGNEFAANGLVYYGLVSGLGMTILMQLRANQIRRANTQYEQALMLSTKQIEFEKIRREEQSQLLTMLMHELKNPLAVIDLAQQTSEDDDAKAYVSRNVTIIRNVLDRCMNADRLSDGRITIQKHKVDLVELIDDLVEQDPSTERRLELTFNTPITTIHTDYQCLRIVLNNLIDNATRYGDPEQPIHLSVDAQPNDNGVAGLAISVTNRPGIASWPDAEKLFHKYYRSPGAKSISGTGLGLFLVSSICTLLGGTCRYEPDDLNVRFKVWIPI